MSTGKNNDQLIILWLSLSLATLIVIASSIGIYTPDFYSKETLNWQTQSAGQDIIDLVLIVPVLISSALLTFVNKKIATFLWGGVLLYLIYTFTIYCFDVHFNKLFVVYCLTLGLSFYSLIYFLQIQVHERLVKDVGNRLVIKVTGTYFLVISGLFYLLWLGEIVPAVVQGAVPPSVLESGLPSNPVHIIDLSVVLPGIFITGLLLLKMKPFGFILTPVLLTFFILMDITIGFLTVMMNEEGLGGNLAVTGMMGLLALFSLALLIWYLQTYGKNSNQ